MLSIRKSTINDLDSVLQIYSYARQFMKETGNPHQWGDSHPTMELVLSDFKEETGFVAVSEDGKIHAVFAFILGEDPTYDVIEGGKWLNNDPYGTIHRAASDGTEKGMLELFLAFCKTQTDNIRVDTHKDNQVMQHILTKNGFRQCGVIYLANGDPRIAYHLCNKRQ